MPELSRRIRATFSPDVDRTTFAGFIRAVSGSAELEGEDGVAGSFDATEPAYLVDRIEAWLDLVDPKGRAQLWSARGGKAFQPGWRGIFEGVDVGRFRIRPPWLEPEPRAEGVILRIDPRGAFGSGEHPTTQLALRLLESLDVAPPQAAKLTMLDVGAGSGILSIAAARCGFFPTALELQPRARESCRATAALNGVLFEISGALVEDLAARFPLVIANMAIGTLRLLLPSLCERAADGGQLILSGASPRELDGLLAQDVQGKALRVVQRIQTGDDRWAACLAQVVSP